MKAKIKFELKQRRDCIHNTSLVMLIKLNGEFFYNYERTIFSNDSNRFRFYGDDFYDEVYKFITNKEKVIEKGKEFVKNILEDKLKLQNEEEIEKLVMSFKPIEIEVK